MSGSLIHSPADIIRRLLILLEQGLDPPMTDSWPIYTAQEPDTPDDVITIYDTTRKVHGRTHYDGQQQEHHGIQLRIRSKLPYDGWTKAKQLAQILDETIYQDQVTMPDDTNYLVHSVNRTGDVLPIGTELESKRSVFTINALTAIRVLS